MERSKGDPLNSLSYRNDSSLSLPNHAGVFVIRTPTSKANFFDLKDFEEQVTACLQYRLPMMQRYDEFIFFHRNKSHMLALSKASFPTSSKHFC